MNVPCFWEFVVDYNKLVVVFDNETLGILLGMLDVDDQAIAGVKATLCWLLRVFARSSSGLGFLC